MAPRVHIACIFFLGGLLAVLPVLLLSAAPNGQSPSWFLQMCLPGPLAALLFGLLFAPRVQASRQNKSVIGGANAGVKIAFCSWLVHAFLIAVPLSHEPGSEFTVQGQFIRSLSASLMISVVAVPFVSLIGGIIGAAYVSRDRQTKDRS